MVDVFNVEEEKKQSYLAIIERLSKLSPKEVFNHPDYAKLVALGYWLVGQEKLKDFDRHQPKIFLNQLRDFLHFQNLTKLFSNLPPDLETWLKDLVEAEKNRAAIRIKVRNELEKTKELIQKQTQLTSLTEQITDGLIKSLPPARHFSLITQVMN